MTDYFCNLPRAGTASRRISVTEGHHQGLYHSGAHVGIIYIAGPTAIDFAGTGTDTGCYWQNSCSRMRAVALPRSGFAGTGAAAGRYWQNRCCRMRAVALQLPGHSPRGPGQSKK